MVEQPIAANIDVALLTMAVDDDFSLRRLERYLTLAWDSGSTPVVVLTKADLAEPETLEDLLVQVDGVAFGVECITTSARTGAGLARLREVLEPGTVGVLLGSSGWANPASSTHSQALSCRPCRTSARSTARASHHDVPTAAGTALGCVPGGHAWAAGVATVGR